MKTQFARIAKFVRMGSTSSVLLMALIEDILDLSKMEAGTFSTTLSDFAVNGLLAEVVDVFEVQ
jgi:signal transduction histidine kinase